MAEPEKNFLQQTIDWFSGSIAGVGDLAKRVGCLLTVLIVLAAAGGFIWWNWDDIAKRPGVESILARFNQRALPTAPAGRLTIAVAHLDKDKDREHETLVRDGLREFEGAEVLRVDRTVDPDRRMRKKPKRKRAACSGKPAPMF